MAIIIGASRPPIATVARIESQLFPVMPRKATKRMVVAAWIIGGIVAALVVVLFTHVDNWQRDLTHNYAATTDDAADPALRPIQSPLEPEEVALDVQTAAIRVGWPAATVTREGERITYHFVRTTPLLRFKDDIHIHLAPHHGGTRITAESQSRLGRGDLGQNPRNLKEILNALRSALAR